MFDIRFGHHLVDVIDQLHKTRRLAIAGLRKPNIEIRADARRISAQHHDAIGQDHCLLNVVRDNEDGARRHLFVEPEFQQFAAQVLRREHVERGERLVHEKHFRFHHQSAREAHALLHAAGKFFGICRLETIQAHRVECAQTRACGVPPRPRPALPAALQRFRAR